MAEYLSPRERALIQKFSENPIDFFTGETRGWLEDFLKTSAPTGAAGTPSSALTGDYKISAQTATHTDSSGTWYLCDGSALPAEEAELIVLVGSNVPDARGRTLTMLGTHVDVNLVGDNEGIGTVADRRPKHNTSVLTNPTISTPSFTQPTVPAHGHLFRNQQITSLLTGTPGGGQTAGNYRFFERDSPSDDTGYVIDKASFVTTGGAVGTPTASGGAYGPGGTAATDQPAFIVPGNLFIHS